MVIGDITARLRRVTPLRVKGLKRSGMGGAFKRGERAGRNDLRAVRWASFKNSWRMNRKRDLRAGPRHAYCGRCLCASRCRCDACSWGMEADRRPARALPAADMSRKPDSPNSGADPFGAPEFQPEQTHRIALWSEHRLLADSGGRGWREVYTSLAAEQPWTRRLEALPHVALAYCTHRPARVSRRIEGDGPGAARQAELRPRLFGMIPSDRDSHWSLHGTPDIQLVYLHRRLIDRIAAEAFGLDPARVEWTFGL